MLKYLRTSGSFFQVHNSAALRGPFIKYINLALNICTKQQYIYIKNRLTCEPIPKSTFDENFNNMYLNLQKYLLDLRFTLKMNVFPSISLATPKMCVETLRTGLVFPRWLIWGVTCLGLLWKMNVFPSISLETPINVCWNPQKRAHMPRFALRINVFPSISLDAKNVSWNHQNRACLSKTINLRGPAFTLKNEFFPINLLGNAKNMCWNPQNRACFCKDNQFEGSHA